jgi:hypothetical protein
VLTGEVTLRAAAAGDGDEAPRFTMVAYSGGLMQPPGYPLPTVVDIAGIEVGKSRPILVDHEETLKATVGHTTEVRMGDTIEVDGVLSGSNDATNEVAGKLAKGSPLQASIGITIPRGHLHHIKAGETVNVNGRAFKGPILLAAKSRLREVSFVPLGADDNTSARLLVASAYQPEGATQVEDQASPADAVEMKAKAAVVPDPVAELRAQYTAEANRVAEVTKLCAKHGDPMVGEGDAAMSLRAKAISEGWSPAETELAAFRAAMPKAPAVHVAQSGMSDADTVEAALASQLYRDEKFLRAHYSDRTLEAATAKPLRNLSLGKLIHESILRAGGHVHPGATGDELLRGYRDHVLRATGISGFSLPGILGAVANKGVWQGMGTANTVFDQISGVESVNNFHTQTRYRMTDSFTFQRVGADGELKHNTLGEQSYTVDTQTYGGILTWTRTQVINDDLGLLRDFPARVGRKWSNAIEQATIGVFTGGGQGFIHADQKNLNTSNALSYDGLSVAEQKFWEQTNPDGLPANVRPSILFVPTSLKALADRLMLSPTLNETTTANKAIGITNVHAGKFAVVTSPYLTTNSATSWYVLASPAEEAAVVRVYLNGQQAPTVEEVDMPADVLGFGLRWYGEFAAHDREFRAVQRNTA